MDNVDLVLPSTRVALAVRKHLFGIQPIKSMVVQILQSTWYKAAAATFFKQEVPVSVSRQKEIKASLHQQSCSKPGNAVEFSGSTYFPGLELAFQS